MKNLTIGERITLGLGTLTLCLAGVAVIAWQSLQQIDQEAHYLKRDVMPGTISSAGFTIGQAENFNRTLLYGQAGDATERQKWQGEMEASSARNTEYLEAYERSITSAEDRDLFNKVQNLRGEYRTARSQYMKLVNANQVQEANDYLETSLVPVYHTYIAEANALFDFNARHGDETAAAIDGIVNRALVVIATVSFSALALAGLTGWLIVRSTTKVMSAVSQQLAAGAEQTAAAASQVSAASQQLAEGATEQAASLEETSASLEEMTSMIKRNAESASKASDIAGQTRAAADAGGADMAAMTAAMNDIKFSSTEVAKIVKDIDEIAFQTNILALNAAVEAARAGEAGAGFAVVADEVRNLAQRCAQSAKATAGKIDAAIEKSERGVEISSRVAAGFAQIAGRTREVDQLVSEIATASGEQAQGIQQVNQAMTQMDQVTQHTAATAEESASAAEELNAQAATVNESVEQLQRLVHGRTRQLRPAQTESRVSKSAPVEGRHSAVRGPASPTAAAGSQALQRLAEPFKRADGGRAAGAAGTVDNAFTNF